MTDPSSRQSIGASLTAVALGAAGAVHLRFGPLHFEEDPL